MSVHLSVSLPVNVHIHIYIYMYMYMCIYMSLSIVHVYIYMYNSGFRGLGIQGLMLRVNSKSMAVSPGQRCEVEVVKRPQNASAGSVSQLPLAAQLPIS